MSPDAATGAAALAIARPAAAGEPADAGENADGARFSGFVAVSAAPGIDGALALSSGSGSGAPAPVTEAAPLAAGDPAAAGREPATGPETAADACLWSDEDRRWMQRALELARAAEAAGEVPVGAVLVRDGVLLGEAGNAPIGCHDPSAHAEIRALRAAGRAAGNYRLPGSTLYVTLEPCPMCAGALVHARVGRVVYAAPDPRTGAAGSVYDLLRDPRLNHRCQVDAGLAAEDSADLLRRFFRARRKPPAAAPDPA